MMTDIHDMMLNTKDNMKMKGGKKGQDGNKKFKKGGQKGDNNSNAYSNMVGQGD